jgi:DDE superfamily endonuclease
MEFESFMKLLGLIHPCLEVNKNKSLASSMGAKPIMLKIQLHCLLQHLAGGSYLDIRKLVKISVASYYHVVNKVMDVINDTPELEITLPQTDAEFHMVKDGFVDKSTGGVFEGCNGALDGWLCQIQTPHICDTPNHMTYFSGHYKCYGVNVQAMCNSECQFMYIGVVCPGSANDVTAYQKSTLPEWIEKLPLGTLLLVTMHTFAGIQYSYHL